MTSVRLYCGLDPDSRTRAVDEAFLEYWGRAVLLLPTRESARTRLESLLLERELPGAWGRPMLTFEDFALGILRGAGLPVLRVGPLPRRLLLEQAVAERAARNPTAEPALGARNRGFLNHLEGAIAQLKQAAIEPEEFRKLVHNRRRPSPLDPVVADLYESYQQRLKEAHIYDRQGVYWEAFAACQKERPWALEGVEALFLDGFDDFTPSEFRLLAALAPYLEHMGFGLNYHPRHPSKRDAQTLQAATAEQLIHTLHAEVVELDTPPPTRYTDFAARHLFWREKPPEPSGLTENLKLTAYPDAASEIEGVAREVKRLILDDGVAPESIAVVFRDLSSEAPFVRATFERLGVPLRMFHDPPLAESALCGYVLTLLDALIEWRREAVIDVLTAPWFNPATEADLASAAREALMPAPTLARYAGIVSGYEEWSAGLERLAREIARGEEDTANPFHVPMADPSAACAALQEAVAQLRALEVLWPAGKAPPKTHAEAIETLLEACGVALGVTALPDAVARERERTAYEALRNVLGVIRRWGGDSLAAMSRSTFLAYLDHILRDTPHSGKQQREGVGCMDLDRARNLCFDYVFLAGVNEGRMPMGAPVNALYGEDDRRDLAEAGLELEGADARNARERLMFHRLFDLPRTAMRLSWNQASRTGRPALPSPFVNDVKELFPGISIAVGDSVADSVSNPWDTLCKRDLCNASVTTAGKGLAKRYPDELRPILDGVAIEAQRYSTAPFGAHDGMLTETDAATAIAALFGEKRAFSVGQLETYAECPFRFFMERVLRVEDVDEPGQAFDPMVFGRLLHETLQRFHSQYCGVPVEEIPAEEGEAALMTLAGEVFDAAAWRSAGAPKGVIAAERIRVKAMLRRYFRLARETRETGWKPAHFEVSFGPTRRKERDPLSTSEPYAISTEAGPAQFSGVIDRIDLKDDQARIIDYKTRVNVSAKAFTEGVSLQLPLYAAALQRLLLPDTDCRHALLVEVGSAKRVHGLQRGTAKDGDEGLEAAREAMQWAETAARHYISKIRAGLFPPLPYNRACHACTRRRPCRYEQSRIDRKPAAPVRPIPEDEENRADASPGAE